MAARHRLIRCFCQFLEDIYGWRLSNTCGSDDASDHQYRTELERAGYTVHTTEESHEDDLTPEELVGNVLSAFPASQLPPDDERAAYSKRPLGALPPSDHFTETVMVKLLVGVSEPARHAR